MSLSPGQRISGYEVVGSIGVGGMGEVYRARDLRLDRDVAIKVLPEAWGEERKHVQRFEREARMLASLNHPNVAHVYGFDEVEGVHMLVLELVEGEELADRIGRGPLPLDETTDLCRQIAEGLEAAHDLGVVHRDLKPANVRITPEGVAKVLDFGLAKSLVPKHETGETPAPSPSPTPRTTFQTEDGLLIGTPTYMSPEQTRGRQVDRRADIWAFGCVLYECLTGKPPFEGETLADTLAAIVKQEPDLTLLPPATPRALYELISRCLVKDPRSRLRDIGEARLVLDRGLADATGSTPVPATAAPATGMHPGVLAAIILGGAIVAAAAMFATQFGDSREPAPERPPAGEPPAPARPDNPLSNAKFTKLTDFAGTEFDASISRDGKFVTFVSDRDGQLDAWVGQIGTGDFRNLTLGREPHWSLRVQDVWFDLEATHVWLSAGVSTKEKWPKRVPVMGGDIRPYFAELVVNTDWSPDGTRIVYHKSSAGDPVFVADADGQNEEMIFTEKPGGHIHFPMWSFDGDWIYFSRGVPATKEMDLWRIRPDGTDVEQMTAGKKDVAYPAPLDADTMLYVAYEQDGTGPWLWMLDVPTKTSQRATVGIERYTSISASEDGRRLVATVANPRPTLWSVPILEDRVAGEDDASILEEVASIHATRPRFGDRGALFFLSAQGVWRHRDGKAVELLSGLEASVQVPVAVSPDGQTLAVVTQRGGARRLEVLSTVAEGSIGRPLPDTVAVHGSPAWSPDGRWIAIGGSDTDGEGLFKFPVDGGEPELITRGLAYNPAWSPNGDLIFYAGTQIMAYHAMRAVRVDDRTHIDLPVIKLLRGGEQLRFLPDGSALVVMQGLSAGQDFWLLDIETLRMRELTKLADRGLMRAFDVDPSGKRIVFDREPPNSDIVLIELTGDGE